MAQAPHPRMHGLTHVTGGSDPVPFLPGFPGTNIDDVIDASAPDAFWKLDETTGVVARDSSGNGWDLGVETGYAPPAWGQPAGPPAALTAGFADGTLDRLSRTAIPAFPGYSGDFSAVIWVAPVAHVTPYAAFEHFLIGQGRPARQFQDGWALVVGGSASLQPHKLRAYIGHGTISPATIYGDTILDMTGATWYQFALTRTAGLFRLYQNGIVQTDTSSAAYTATGGVQIGDDRADVLAESVYALRGRASYAAVWGRALTSTELLAMIDAAAGGTDNTDLVLGLDENGNPVWVQPKVEVTVNGETPDTTPNPAPGPVPPPDTGGPDGSSWIQDQPFTWSGPTFQVPPNKWTTIPFTNPLMERQSTPSGGATTWYELDWDDPDAAGWIDPATPRVITVPHDIPFDPGNSGFWLQICLKLETPPVEDEIFVEGSVTRGSHRGLRVFETTHQKSVMEAFNWRGACCDEHGAIDVFRDPTKHPGLLGDANMFALGDPGGDHNLEHGNIMIVPNSGYGYYLPGADWLPGHTTGNPVLKKGMRLVPQVWHNASTTLTFDCTGVLPYRPHFVLTTPALRSWGPPWSGWPT